MTTPNYEMHIHPSQQGPFASYRFINPSNCRDIHINPSQPTVLIDQLTYLGTPFIVYYSWIFHMRHHKQGFKALKSHLKKTSPILVAKAPWAAMVVACSRRTQH